jgi:hypothetical protein
MRKWHVLGERRLQQRLGRSNRNFNIQGHYSCDMRLAFAEQLLKKPRHIFLSASNKR